MNSHIVLELYNEKKLEHHASILANMVRQNPKLADWSNDELEKLYASAVSGFQSKEGKHLEHIVEDLLEESKIPFMSQVHLDSDGIIVKSGGCTIPDIVFGSPVVGDHISKYAVLSLKTSSRERGKLDTAWTNKHPPKLFLYGTLEQDYPQPGAFNESPTRKLVCAVPKQKDNRQFKLEFEDILDEVMRVLE